MEFERIFRSALRDRLRRFPAVTILGPRQSGKTTFVRQALPEWSYLDLERPADAAPEWLEAYGRAFIERDLPALGIDVSAILPEARAGRRS